MLTYDQFNSSCNVQYFPYKSNFFILLYSKVSVNEWQIS